MLHNEECLEESDRWLEQRKVGGQVATWVSEWRGRKESKQVGDTFLYTRRQVHRPSFPLS